jgi:hypothetical protein
MLIIKDHLFYQFVFERGKVITASLYKNSNITVYDLSLANDWDTVLG